MRFMILVKGTKDSEAGKMPPESLLAEMATYHEALAKAGVLLDGNGLKPTSTGWRILFAGDKRTVVDGPFTESKEVIAGYTIIQTKTREEALAWAKRMPNPAGPGKKGEIEIRQMFELEDFAPGEAIDRFEELNAAKDKRKSRAEH